MSLSLPHLFRTRHRREMNEAMCGIVQKRKSLEEVIVELNLSVEDALIFRGYLLKEFKILAGFNCAQFKYGGNP
jgi:hypothetical protein